MKIVYVTPIYKPAVGGAAVYVSMMGKYFSKSHKVESFTVITENHPNSSTDTNEQRGDESVIRLFPFRAGRQAKDTWSYILYLLQNIQYFYLLWYLLFNRVDVLFIHSSLHNNPNLLYWVLRIAKILFRNTQYVLDVRDPKLPVSRFYQCRIYDSIISCSENVTQHIKKDECLSGKVIEIPIPIEKIDLSLLNREDILNDYGLCGKKYIFNGSGCTLEKGIKRLTDVVRRVRKTNDIVLVVAGKKRYWDEDLERAKSDGWLICTGEIPQDVAMLLSKNSVVDVNASSVDSMPRHSLEAFINGSTILLPRGIPEFEKKCPHVVVDFSSTDNVVSRINGIINGATLVCEYDLENHNPETVFNRYITLLGALTK